MTTTIEDDGLRAEAENRAKAIIKDQTSRWGNLGWGSIQLVNAIADGLLDFAALRSSPAVDGVGEPVAWMATSQSGGVMVESANLKSILIERANTLYGNGAYELTPLCPNSDLGMAIEVKQLEWSKHTDDAEWYSEDDPSGANYCLYVIDGRSGDAFELSITGYVEGSYRTEAEAKAAAQADYETRVRSALSPTSDRASVVEACAAAALGEPENALRAADPDHPESDYACGRVDAAAAVRAALSPRSS